VCSLSIKLYRIYVVAYYGKVFFKKTAIKLRKKS